MTPRLEDELPPGEDVTGRPFAIGKPLTTSVPALPYQIGLKLIMFDDPPVGVRPERIDVIPQQMHDIDSVAVKMTRPEDWSVLGGYVRRRYVKERRFQDLPVEDEAPWAGIARRLDEWARCDVDAAMWKLVQNLQSALLGRASRRSPGEWRARARRLSVMARAAGTDRTDLYLRALELERTIDPALSGREARKPRAAIGTLMGPYWAEHKNKLNGYGLRTTYWEALAISDDLELRLNELAALTTAEARTSR